MENQPVMILAGVIYLASLLRDEGEKYIFSTFTEYLEVKYGRSGKTPGKHSQEKGILPGRQSHADTLQKQWLTTALVVIIAPSLLVFPTKMSTPTKIPVK
jgi:hypothetical protein